MKTPKRYPSTRSVYAARKVLLNDRARWKRKNKIAQLKRTIARQKAKIYALEFKCEMQKQQMLTVEYTLKRQLEGMNKAYFSHANALNKLIDLKKP